MKPGQNNRRQRGRGRNKPQQGFSPNRVYESNGPDVKVRGTAAQVLEKYQALARDAQSSGDRVMAENLLQHAEHYQRLLNVVQEHMQAEQAQRDEERAGREETRHTNGHGHHGDEQHDNRRDDRRDDEFEHGQLRDQARDQAADRGAAEERHAPRLEQPNAVGFDGSRDETPVSADNAPSHDQEDAPKRRRGRPPKVKAEPDPAEAEQPSMLANGAD